MDSTERSRGHLGAFYREFESLLMRCFIPVQTNKGPAIVIRKDRRTDWEGWFQEESLGTSQDGGSPK